MGMMARPHGAMMARPHGHDGKTSWGHDAQTHDHDDHDGIHAGVLLRDADRQLGGFPGCIDLSERARALATDVVE